MNSISNNQSHINQQFAFQNNNGTYIVKHKMDVNTLDMFLENEKNNNNNESWSKLNKTIKTKKMLEYALIYKKKYDLDDDEYNSLILFLKDCIDKKRLQKIKDVTYDKITGTISDIPVLQYVKSTKHFTLKNTNKHTSTLKSLPKYQPHI